MSSPASSIFNKSTELENLIAQTDSRSLKSKEEDSSISIPRLHMSILSWLQVMSIIFTFSYFLYSHINENETSNLVIKSRQDSLGKRLDTVEGKLDLVDDSVNKLSGKIDILVMLASKK